MNMHEFPVAEQVLDMVIKHAQANNAQRVKSVYMRIVKLSRLSDQWIEHYFGLLSMGTPAEGAAIIIGRTPFMFTCHQCSKSYEACMKRKEKVYCPSCGRREELLSMREYFIEKIELI